MYKNVQCISELPQEIELDNAALSVTGTSVLIYENCLNLSMLMDYSLYA